MEAVKALERTPYDIVLMDVQMPEMDGLEATKIIRDPHSKVLNRNVVIIAMTAHAMKGDRERCLEVGMDDYVSKPIRPQKLLEVIERQIQKATSAETAAAGESEAPAEVKEVFDWAAFLERLEGDEELCRELVDLFMRDVPEQVEQLKQGLDNDDAEMVERRAHTIKGASANIGARALSEVAFEIELAGKEQELGKARLLVGKLENELERLSSVLVGV